MPTITNQLNLWDENGTTASASTVESSASLASNTKRQNGFVQNGSLPSKTFNGILKEMSLVTKSFISALGQINTNSSADDLTVNNDTSSATLASTIASIFNNLTVTYATNATNASVASAIAGGAIGQVPYQSAANTTTFVTGGTAGQVLKLINSGGSLVPSWQNESGGSGGGGSSETATKANNLANGSAGQIPYQSAINTTTFVGGSAGDAGKVLVSGGTSAPTFTNTLGTWSYTNSAFYSGSHSSASDENAGTLLNTIGLHVRSNDASVKLINAGGTNTTELGVAGLTTNGTSLTSASLTPIGNFTIGASGKTTSLIGNTSLASVSAMNVLPIIVDSTQGLSGNAGDIVFVI